MDKRSKRLIALAAEGIREVADEFADELERRPTSGELFEILTWALKSGGEERLSDTHPSNLVALRPRLRKGATRADSSTEDVTDSAVAELNDAVFVAASDFLSQLTDAFKSDTGHPPTLSDLCDLLVEGLHQCGEQLLSDVAPAQVTGVRPEVRKRKRITPKIGDVVAIPAKNGEYFIAVVLTKNVFGTAFGFFEGTSAIKPVSKNSHPPIKPHPVYSDDERIAGGSWKIIGHDEDLLTLFPPEPEVYHYQHEDDPDPLVGPYGSGETASGLLRALTKEEAAELGLLTGEYRQTYMSETLENYLNSKLS